MIRRLLYIIFAFMVLLLAIGSIGCDSDKSTSLITPTLESNKTIAVSSVAFQNGGSIPDKYTCHGDDVSPPIEWSGVPDGVKSFAIIVDDLDAPGGDFVHWVVYNLPPDLVMLPEGVKYNTDPAIGGLQGENDFKGQGYNGPCPPRGKEHRYFFKLYALDTMLDLEAGVTKDELLNSIEGHIVAYGELEGKYIY